VAHHVLVDGSIPNKETAMTEVAATDLSTVVGGASSVSAKLDQQTELALTKLNSDLKDLARPQQNTNQQLTMLMAAAMMSRFR
jgi:hypothetical protein